MTKITNQKLSKITKKIAHLANQKINFLSQKIIGQFSGSKMYLVGGLIRDVILGHQSKDFDFVVSGVPKKDLEKFLKNQGKVVEIESRFFGVFKFLPFGSRIKEPVDIALPRKERFVGLGYKDIKVQSLPNLDIKTDLSRRDFTFNTLTLDLKEEKLLDYFGGLEDLNNQIIRAIGDPGSRFYEDPSRILRAIRFACVLDFTIEEKTWASLKKLVPEVNRVFKDKNGKLKERVAREVIAQEFLKSFNANPLKTLNLYDQSGLLKLLFPEIKAMQGVAQPPNFHSEGDVWTHTALALKNLPQKASLDLKLGVLFHDIAKPITFEIKDRIRFNEHDSIGGEVVAKIFKRLKLSSFPKESSLYADQEKISFMVKHHLLALHGKPQEMTGRTIEKYFFRKDNWGDDLLELMRIDAVSTIPEKGKPDLSNYKALLKRIEEIKKITKTKKKLPPDILSGEAIMKFLKISPSPLVGEIKKHLRELQLQGKIKTKKQALEILTKGDCHLFAGPKNCFLKPKN